MNNINDIINYIISKDDKISIEKIIPLLFLIDVYHQKENSFKSIFKYDSDFKITEDPFSNSYKIKLNIFHINKKTLLAMHYDDMRDDIAKTKLNKRTIKSIDYILNRFSSSSTDDIYDIILKYDQIKQLIKSKLEYINTTLVASEEFRRNLL